MPRSIRGVGIERQQTLPSRRDYRIGHVVLEKNRIGHAWREDRWDTFCLVTPNWQCTLPDYPYAGDDPDGFMLKDQIVKQDGRRRLGAFIFYWM